MRYLLDTHIWLWSLLTPDKLNNNVEEVLRNNDNEFYISPITIWETLILAERGRIELYPTPEEWIVVALERSSVKEAKLSHAIAIKSRSVQLPHKDPADRFIAATAFEYDLTLITVDEKLRKSKEIKIF